METDETFSWPDNWENAIPAIRRAVHSVCYRSKLSASDVEDMTQTVLMLVVIKATKPTGSFPSIKSLCAWAFTVARRRIIKRSERQARERIDRNVDVSAVPQKAADWTDEFAEYLPLIDDERERELCRLMFEEHLTQKEAASRLGISPALANRLCQRAFKKLRGRLSE